MATETLPAVGVEVYNDIFDGVEGIFGDLNANHGMDMKIEDFLPNYAIKDSARDSAQPLNYANLDKLIDAYESAVKLQVYAKELDDKYEQLVAILAMLIIILNWLFVKVVVNPYDKKQNKEVVDKLTKASKKREVKIPDYNDEMMKRFLRILKQHKLIDFELNESDIKNSKIVFDMHMISKFIEHAAQGK